MVESFAHVPRELNDETNGLDKHGGKKMGLFNQKQQKNREEDGTLLVNHIVQDL